MTMKGMDVDQFEIIGVGTGTTSEFDIPETKIYRFTRYLSRENDKSNNDSGDAYLHRSGLEFINTCEFANRKRHDAVHKTKSFNSPLQHFSSISASSRKWIFT